MMTSAWTGSHLHMLFALVLLIGLILFIVWAARVLDKKSLGTWVVWLILVGTLGMLLTSILGANTWMNTMHSSDNANPQEVGQNMGR